MSNHGILHMIWNSLSVQLEHKAKENPVQPTYENTHVCPMKMNSQHGAQAMATDGNLASFRDGFNPPEEDTPQAKEHEKEKVLWKTPRQTKLDIVYKDPKKVKVNNNAIDKDTNVLMELLQKEDILSTAATKATGAKTIYIYQMKIDCPVPDNT